MAAGDTGDKERVSFTKASAQRIADAVRGFEEGNRDSGGFIGAPRYSPPGQPIKFGTFEGSWPIDSSTVVSDLIASNRTYEATNLFADIPECGSGRRCAIARCGTAWYLIAAQCQ